MGHILEIFFMQLFKVFARHEPFWDWLERICMWIFNVFIGIIILALAILLLYAVYKLMRILLRGVKNIFAKRKLDESLLFLGISYEYGDGVEKDLEKAMQCYKKAYELGNVNAYERY